MAFLHGQALKPGLVLVLVSAQAQGPVVELVPDVEQIVGAAGVVAVEPGLGQVLVVKLLL